MCLADEGEKESTEDQENLRLQCAVGILRSHRRPQMKAAQDERHMVRHGPSAQPANTRLMIVDDRSSLVP